MRPITTALVTCALALVAVPVFADSTATKSVPPAIAWGKLANGNTHFVHGRSAHPNQSVSRRDEVAKGQHPFAVIVGCSDSRLSPEIVFDQGLGDLFVVRVAGNIVDDNALGSIEYAVEHLGARLIVVLGHEKCGAVAAAVASDHADGHVDSIVKAIQPAVVKAKAEQGDVVDNAVKENVRQVVAEIRSSEPVLAKLVKSGKIRVIGARYDLDSGKVQVVK